MQKAKPTFFHYLPEFQIIADEVEGIRYEMDRLQNLISQSALISLVVDKKTAALENTLIDRGFTPTEIAAAKEAFAAANLPEMRQNVANAHAVFSKRSRELTEQLRPQFVALRGEYREQTAARISSIIGTQVDDDVFNLEVTQARLNAGMNPSNPANA